MSEALPEVPIRVFLLIENRLLRDVLERLFRKRLDLQVVGCCELGAGGRETLASTPCDVVVLDFIGTDWAYANLEFKNDEAVAPKAILIGMNDEPEQFLAAIRGGIAGYLLKDASAADVVAAVRSTFRGEAVCPPKLCAALFQYVSRTGPVGGATAGGIASKPSLTLRQQRLITLVAEGLTNKEIGLRLNISEYTVKNHIHRILKNVDADTRSQAVEAARSHGYSLGAADHA